MSEAKTIFQEIYERMQKCGHETKYTLQRQIELEVIESRLADRTGYERGVREIKERLDWLIEHAQDGTLSRAGVQSVIEACKLRLNETVEDFLKGRKV